MAKAQFRVRVEPVGRGLTRLDNLVKQWDQDFPDDVATEMADIRRVTRSILRHQPGRPVYPIYWTPSKHPEDAGKKPNTKEGFYSRQKAAYILSQGFGKGIPSPRTGNLIGSWEVRTRRTKSAVSLDISNTAPEFPYVQGDFRQEMFGVEGSVYTWKPIEVLLEEVDEYLGKAIPIAIDRVIDRYDEKDLE